MSEEGKPKYLFCVDYRALNAVTRLDSYPPPRFEETTSTLAGSRLFTVLECLSGFWKIYIHEPHRQNPAYMVPGGHYEFNRMPYGISDSPASFQRLMDRVLRNLIGPESWIFI
jgi:Reverse transcriptase (RNA-dependent DNA polymerase).